jgi:hypothetical protein
MAETDTAAAEAEGGEEQKEARSMSREELQKVSRGESERREEEEAEEETGEKSGGEAEGETTGEGEVDTRDQEIEELRTLLKKRDADVKEQQRVLDKFGTELGVLRKQAPEDVKAEIKRIQELYIEDPVEGHKALREHFKKEEDAAVEAQEQEAAKLIETNRRNIHAAIEGFEENQADHVTSFAELMAADGAPVEVVEKFKVNPYIMDSTTMFNLSKRVAAQTEITDLKAQLEAKDTEIEGLKKQSGQVLSNIEKAAKKKTLSGKEGGGAASTNLYEDKPVTNLSRDELKKLARGEK